MADTLPLTSSQEDEFEFRKYIDIVLRRCWVIIAVTIVAGTVTALVTFTLPPVFKAQALLLIEKERGGTKLSDGVAVESTQDDYYQTQYMLLKTDFLLRKVYRQVGLGDIPEFENPNGLAKLRDAIGIHPVRRSRLVHVAVESLDPGLAARIANALSDAYVRQNIENQLFISKEILHALEVDSSTNEGRRLQESLPAVVNNPLIQQLKADLAKLEAQIADLGRRYKKKHPVMSSLVSNKLALAAQLREETDRVVASLKTELSGQLKGNNVRVVDQAVVPIKPFKPRKLRNLAVGLFLGLVGGVLLAILIETLDQTVRTQEDVEEKLSQPFLGMVPFLQLPEKSLPYEPLMGSGPSLTSESFRNLRTMVDFANVAERSQCLLVTSAVQEEGKSYIMSNLAVAFAQLGERVLLIDGDLRRPKVHKSFALSSKAGLSDFLAQGKHVDELEDLLQTPNIPNLKVLVCGTRPPNPSELLNTPRLGAAVSWAKSNFDRVLIDCTPMFPIHDTLLWGRHVRSAVYVVRYGKTAIHLLNRAIQRLTTGGVKMSGVVVNAAKSGGLTYSGYGYYYQHYYRSYDEAASSAEKV